MMRLIKIISLLALMMAPFITIAQQKDKKVEMADLMRSNGMIYVVVAVVVTILIGLILYIWRLDRKMTKLEKESKANS